MEWDGYVMLSYICGVKRTKERVFVWNSQDLEVFETFAEKQSFVGAFAGFVKVHEIYFD